MEKYLYEFNPSDCENIYFDKLLKFLSSTNPEFELYERMSEDNVKKLKIKCTYKEITKCEKDNYFFENKVQIILGRFYDTIGCFYNCKENYFAMAMKSYSLFKNDIFIRYIIDKPNIFINNIENIKLENIFPIRILLSKKHLTTTHKLRDIINLTEYYEQTIPEKILAISKKNLDLLLKIDNNNVIKKKITEKNPVNHIIGRELCLIYKLNYYFYVVENNDKSIKPFILISKYSLDEINLFYERTGLKHENLKLLYTRKNLENFNYLSKNICLKSNYQIITNNYEKILNILVKNINGVDKKKYLNTINYLWNYIGYFIIITSDNDKNIKSYFFQNNTSNKKEIKMLVDKIKNYYGDNYINYLKNDFAEIKIKKIKKIYKILNKKIDDMCTKNYNLIDLDKPENLVIMNNLIWQIDHSYKSSDYYTSIYINMFTQLINKFSIENKIFFINYFDRPVLHKQYKFYLFNTQQKHNINDYYPIYSPTTSDKFADIPIPTPDLWKIITKLNIGDSCENNYSENNNIFTNFNEKINKIVFRGTNTSMYPNDLNKNERLSMLKKINDNNEISKEYFDVGITNLTKTNILLSETGEIVYSDISKIKLEFKDFNLVKFIPMNEQSKYKYILDIDGISTAWRLPYYMNFNSVIFKKKSDFYEYYYKLKSFDKSIIYFDNDDFFDKFNSIIKNQELAKRIANNSVIFFEKNFNITSVLNYLYNITK